MSAGCPTGKRRFATGAQARAATQGIRKRGERRERKPGREYEFPTCRGWHLTSEPR